MGGNIGHDLIVVMSVYKGNTKILAFRLETFLPDSISRSRSAFVEGRDIRDKIRLAHELVKGYSRREMSPRCLVKADIMNALDSIHLSFHLNIPAPIDVARVFFTWIEAYITGARVLCLNGFNRRVGIEPAVPQ
ncbi:hypothetical protein CRG98_039424 [Punica granatum]|uniref:Uncharacterized protein n=1 Tax=Punica granatum TaxID=22663 RepID=A0A2I0I860_PUNGR|nr:hypothetical protein CRG98_039424 [Punica granatum]